MKDTTELLNDIVSGTREGILKRAIEVLSRESIAGLFFETALDEDDETERDFSRLNYHSFLITLLYTKLIQDGYIEPIQGITQEFYPFWGDVECKEPFRCAVMKRALEAAGFEWPSDWNYIPLLNVNDNGCDDDERYSVASNNPEALADDAVRLYDDEIGEYCEEIDIEALIDARKEDYPETEDDEQAKTIEDAFCSLTWQEGIYLCVHPKFQYVKALLEHLASIETGKQSDISDTDRKAAADRSGFFDFEEYKKIQNTVYRVSDIDEIGGCFNSAGNPVIYGTRVYTCAVGDMQPDYDGYGYGGNFLNPLALIPAHIPLIADQIGKDIDQMYKKYFGDHEIPKRKWNQTEHEEDMYPLLDKIISAMSIPPDRKK